MLPRTVLLLLLSLMCPGFVHAQDQPVSAVDSLPVAAPPWHDLTVPSEDYAREQALRKKLDRLVTVDFEGVELRDALRQVLKPLDIQFVIAEKELSEEGDSADVQVNLVLNDIPAWQALELILEQHDLSWYPEESIVMITTWIAEWQRRVTRVYDVEPLLSMMRKNPVKSVSQPGDRLNMQNLPWVVLSLARCWFATDVHHWERLDWEYRAANFFYPYAGKKTVESMLMNQLLQTLPQSTSGEWTSHGADGGSISIVGNRIVVSQTRKVHREIQQLLRAMGELLSGTTPQHWSSANPFDTQANQVRQALEQRVTLHVKDMSLQSVLHVLTRRTGVQFYINEKEIREEGGSADVQITVVLDDVRLETLLRQILEPHELTVVLDSGLLKLTSVTAAQGKLYTVVYDVKGICPWDNPGPVMEAIQESTSGFWADSIGGGIDSFFSRLLIVRQTAKVHREIEQLLDTLRLANQREAAAKK